MNVSGTVLPVGASESLLLTQTTDNLNKVISGLMVLIINVECPIDFLSI